VAGRYGSTARRGEEWQNVDVDKNGKKLTAVSRTRVRV